MAIRKIRIKEDSILRKNSRKVTNYNDRLFQLIDDLADTMYDAPGVGLAAVQVGVLKRVAVIDTGEGLIEIINGEVIKEEGKKIDIEGCLSIPDTYGRVERPEKVTVKYNDRFGETQVIEAEGLLAVALCHEIDHFDGKLFTDIVIEYINLNETEEDEDNPEL